jgi:DNA-binding transcriptional MerR regulator
MIGKDRLSIKEFSKLTGVKETTLRYYDDMGLFSPAVRGENKYRYYSPQQLTTINAINMLHELDMSMKRIGEIERTRSPESIYEVLGERERELEEELSKLNQSFNIIHTLRDMISEGLEIDEHAISVVKMDELHMKIGDKNVFGQSSYFYDAFTRFCYKAKEKGIDLRFPIGGMFDDFETYLGDARQPGHWFSVDPSGDVVKPAGKYVVGYDRGYYGDEVDLPQRMEAYIKEHSLKPKGPVYGIYLHDEICLKDPDNYLLQASVRV